MIVISQIGKTLESYTWVINWGLPGLVLQWVVKAISDEKTVPRREPEPFRKVSAIQSALVVTT